MANSRPFGDQLDRHFDGKSNELDYYTGPLDKQVDKLEGRKVDNAVVNQNQASGCTAVAGSQGEDYDVQYVSDQTLNPNFTVKRIAYVECGYVE